MKAQNSNVIPNFTSLTPKEVMLMSITHILTTRVQCRDEAGVCTYGGPGCAAAPFLTPEARETLEGSWYGMTAAKRVPETNSKLIQAIQQCHDSWRSEYGEFVPYFLGGMMALAHVHNIYIARPLQGMLVATP